MIIRNYILKEVLLTLLAVLTVVLLIFFSLRFVRVLGDVASGSLPAELVFTVLSFEMLRSIGSILPVVLFFSVLLAFGRLYRDQEMVALTASGIGQLGLTRVLFWLVPAVLVINGTFTLYVAPWASAQRDSVRHEAENRSELSLLVAGRFTESKSGKLVMYVEELSDDQRQLKNVFVQSRNRSKKSILSSASGYRYVDKDSGDEFMVMEDGYRYVGEPGQDDYRITKFKKHAVRIEEKATEAVYLKRSATPTEVLWASTKLRDKAELQKRIILPLSAVALMLLAVPLSRVQPREGRYGRVFSAVLIYVIFNNLLGASYNWIARGNISTTIGMWWLPVLLLVIASMYALWQMRGQTGWLRDRMAGYKLAGSR